MKPRPTELPAASQSSMPIAHLWPIPHAPGTATSAAISMVYLLAHPSLTVMGISDLAAITDKHLTTLETLGPLPLAVSALQETKEMGVEPRVRTLEGNKLETPEKEGGWRRRGKSRTARTFGVSKLPPRAADPCPRLLPAARRTAVAFPVAVPRSTGRCS